MPRSVARRLFRRPAPLAVTRLEDRTTPTLFSVTSAGSIAGLDNNGCVAAGDFNEDGKADLVLANYGSAVTGKGTVTVALSNGDGTFTTAGSTTVGSGHFVSFVSVGDLDGDGHLDLATASSLGTARDGFVTVFKGSGLGTFGSKQQYPSGGHSAFWVGIGRFNADARPDLVVANGGSDSGGGSGLNQASAAVFIATAAGDYTQSQLIRPPLADVFIPLSGTVGDFNGDGKDDVVFTVPGVDTSGTGAPYLDGSAVFYKGLGDGTLEAGNAAGTAGKFPVNIQSADLTGDGKLDLVVANAGDPNSSFAGTSIGVLKGVGDGNFLAATPILAGISGAGAFATALADFDGDGDVDIAAVAIGDSSGVSAGKVAVYQNNGTGSFALESTYTLSLLAGQYVAAGDYRNRGVPDLVAVGAAGSPNTLLNSTVASAASVTGLTSSLNPAGYGSPVTFTAAVTSASGSPAGTVTFYDGTTQLGSPVALVSGSAQYMTGSLGVATHTVTAKYGGGAGFSASTSPAVSQVVTKASTLTNLSAAPTPVPLGGTVTLTALVGPAAVGLTGSVTFFDGAAQLGAPVPLTAGKAELPVTTLTAGPHTLTAVYGGAANFAVSTSAPAVVTVNPPSPPPSLDSTVRVQSSANPSGFGGSLAFTATVTATGGTPTGSVTFFDGATPLGAALTLAGGTASLPAGTLPAGSHAITAKYGGAAGFNSATSGVFVQVVTPAGTTTVLATSLTPAAVSQPVTLTATVLSGVAVGGGVRFLDNGVAVGSPVPVGVGGVATFTTGTLALGTHSLTAEFVPQTGDYLPSTSAAVSQLVQKGGVTVTVGSGGASLVSQPVNLVATLVELPNLPADPTGTVTFKLDGNPIGTATVNGGTAALLFSGLPVGGGTITAEYAGDGSFAGGTSAGLFQPVNKGGASLTLQAGGPASVGVPVTFVATVAEAPSLAPDPTGVVVFKRDGIVIGTAPLSGGSATFVTSALPVGTRSITAEYAGDANFGPAASGPVSQQILPAASAVRLATSSSPATVTAEVALTATVTSAGSTAGTVQFFAGGTAISGLVPVTGGAASFRTAALPVGTSTLTAQFNPADASVAGSTSAGLTQQVVRAAPAVTLTVDPAAAGQPSALRAAVAKPTGVAADPGGTVTFKLNGTAVATVPVVGGLATASVLLPSGASAVTAEFAGDSNFSTGAASVQAAVSTPPKALVREFGVGAGAGRAADARFFNPDGGERFTAAGLFGGTGGVRVTSADFTGDGVADLVAGTGPGGPTRVVVLDGVTRAQLFAIDPFEASFTGGVYVSAGDLTGDGVADLVISPDEGGGPRVRVFNGKGFGGLDDFFGIDDPNFRGGARAGVADLTGDGVGDLVVAAGFGGGPRVAVFDGRGLGNDHRKPYGDFYVFEETLRNGAFVAAGDVDGDGVADLISGGGPGGGPRVIVTSGADLMRGRTRVIADFFAGSQDNRGGVRVAARNLDGDQFADVVTGSGPGGGSRVTGYTGKTLAGGSAGELFGFDAFTGFDGGVYVG